VVCNRRIAEADLRSRDKERYVTHDLAEARNLHVVVNASGWFAGFSAVTSLVLAVVGVIIAVLAAILSYRAIRVAHGDAVSDRLFSSLGDLLAALVRIDFAVQEITRLGGGEPKARAIAMPDFIKFREAVAHVNLARAQRNRNLVDRDPIGTWILNVANNLAVALLQADESAAVWGSYVARESERFPGRPNFVPDQKTWSLLARSGSFWTAYHVARDLDPQPDGDPRFDPLDEWWANQVEHGAAMADGRPSVYDPNADWLTQHARLLADFGECYIARWAEDLVAAGELRRNVSRTKRHRGRQTPADQPFGRDQPQARL
jgi:hypothetical protein